MGAFAGERRDFLEKIREPDVPSIRFYKKCRKGMMCGYGHALSFFRTDGSGAGRIFRYGLKGSKGYRFGKGLEKLQQNAG